ncbi:MAG: O-antigen ligase family protein [Caldilineaceae bacterium]
MRTIAYWLTLLTIILMPWESFLILPGVGTASRFVGVVAAAFWVFTVFYTGKFRKLAPFHLVAFLFFLWNAITILWSIDPVETFLRSLTYMQLALFSLMLWDLFPTRANIQMGLQAYVLGAYVPAGSTIYNYMNGIAFSYGRYASTGDNPNTTGILVALALPLVWYLAASSDTTGALRRLRWVNYVYIPVAMFAILLTATRFALLMAVPAMLFGLSTAPRLSMKLRVLIFVAVLVALYGLSSWVPETALDRFATIDDEIQGGDLSDRTVLWDIGINMWLDHPFIGIGSGGYNMAVAPIFGRPRSIHNTFISVLVELGAVGICLFLLLLLMALLHIVRHSAWEFRFWLTTVGVWLMGNLLLTWIYYKPTWLVLGLLAASAGLAGHKSEPEPDPETTALVPAVVSRLSHPLPPRVREQAIPAPLVPQVAKTTGAYIVKRA